MSYEFSPLTIVGSIRGTLGGVTGFSIVKELVQNANDSRAQNWVIGWSEGLHSARHPLLRDPALYVVNDGAFTSRDAKALRQLHISGRADDPGSIGKFGLGLKSIYRICEAFFFFNAAGSAEHFEDRYPGVNIISPWLAPKGSESEGARDDWGWGDSDESHDSALVREYLTKQSGLEGFALWIPLRTSEQCKGPGHSPQMIHTELFDEPGAYPRDILSDNLVQGLVQLWPMLSSIRRMVVLPPPSQPRTELLLSETSTVRDFPQRVDTQRLPRSPRQFAGTIMSSDARKWVYNGQESAVRDLLSLRSHTHWPRSLSVGLERNVEVEDKSVPHSAAVFQKSGERAGPGVLRFWWSVFLPAGHRPAETVRLRESAVDFDLTLHGFFFLSPDRSEILEWANEPGMPALQDDREVQRYWNSQLARRGTLANVLPALKSFSNQLTGVEVEELTLALQSSAVFSQYRAEICVTNQWVHRLLPSGTSAWRLESNGAVVYSLPETNHTRFVFPNLLEIASDMILVNERDALLTPGLPTAHWPKEALTRLFADISMPHLLADNGLSTVLALVERQDPEVVWPVLIPVLQKLFSEADEAFLRNRVYELRSLLEHVPEASRFSIPRGTNATAVSRILALKLGFLVVPPALETRGAPSIATGDAIRLLECLEGLPDVQAIVYSVLAHSEHRERVLQHTQSARLYGIEEVSQPNGQRISSLAELVEFARSRTLFTSVRGDGSKEASYTVHKTHEKALQRSLGTLKLYLIDGSMASLLGLDTGPCDRRVCLELLRTRPQLSPEASARIELVNDLWMQYALPDDGKALRYLLHAHSTNYESLALLYVPSSGDQTWSRIVACALADVGQGWRWLKGLEGIEDRLNGIILRQLGIEISGKSTRLVLLNEHRDAIKFTGLQAEDYDFLLSELGDSELARTLPIHERIDGNRVVLTDSTYLEGGFQSTWQGSQDLFADITLVKRHPRLHYLQASLGLTPLGYHSVIQHALRKPDPSLFWRDIMSVLPHISKTSFGLHLQNVPWLPGRDERPLEPRFVIHIEGAEQAVTTALHESNSNYVGSPDLSVEVRSHPQFSELVTKVLPERADAIDSLAEALSASPTYHVGEFNALGASPEPAQWASALGERYTLAPALAVIKALGDESQPVWDALNKEVTLDKILEYLAALRDRYSQETSRDGRQTVLKVHNAYLSLAAMTPGWHLEDDRVRLLAQDGVWRLPAELSHGQAGVDRRYLVVEEQASSIGAERKLRERIDQVAHGQVDNTKGVDSALPASDDEWQRIEEKLNETAETLDGYFGAWRGNTKDELIGGFLALLGDDARVRALAQGYLGNWDIWAVRAKLNTSRSDGLTFQQILEQYRFIVKIESGATFRVENLLGDPIVVSSSTDPDTIFAGRIDHAKRDGLYFVGLRLLKVNPEAGADHLGRMLSDSAEKVLMGSLGFLRSGLSNLEHLWEELKNSGQLDLAVTRGLVLDSAVQYIKGQLGVRSEALSKLFKEWDDARYALGTNEQLDAPDQREIDRARETINNLKRALGSLLESDVDVQFDVLQAVRKKLVDYQYSPDSIPFELFQNADDALVELQATDQVPSGTTFVVLVRDTTIDFIHWGRPINFGGRAKDFHRDLEKMLVINASGKSTGTTGKFGLGFKSVFLATDAPQVASHDLHFEVRAGVLPAPLSSDAFADLRSTIEDYGPRTGTITRLSVKPELIRDMVHRFQRLSGLMLLFAKQIDRCIVVENGRRIETSWESRTIGSEPITSHWNEQGRVLRLAAGTLSVLVRVSAEGFEPFAVDVPSIWVMAPTRETSRLGVVINGEFDLDTGRAQLARDSGANLAAAREAGPKLEALLRELADLPDAELARRLEIRTADSVAIWSSALNVFSHGFNLLNQHDNVNQVAWELLWGNHGAYSNLLASRQILPTRLPAPFDGTTQLTRVTHMVAELLAEPDVLEAAISWPAFIRDFKSGQVIHQDVAGILKRVRIEHEVQPLTLVGLLERQLGPLGVVSAELADSLGRLIEPEWFNRLNLDEQENLNRALAGSQFLAQNGTYVSASSLLVADSGSGTDEESMRAAFAPRANVLSDTYTAQGRAFFRVCRGPMRAVAATLQSWILSASTNGKQTEALRYLLYGELSHLGLRPGLKRPAADSWLSQYHTVPGFTVAEYAELKSYLGFATPEPQTDAEEPLEAPILLSSDPSELLTWVYDFWDEQREETLARHEQITFPFELILHRDYDPTSMDQRRSWFVLLLAGSMLSLGRVRSQQNRGFLEKLDDKGWLETALDKASRPDAWVSIIEEYFEDAIINDTEEYRYWMSQFLAIYQLSNWLDAYVRLILDLDKTDEQGVIEGIWSPMTLPALSGSGIQVPPLRKVLNLGRTFVVRELRRRGVLTNPLLDAYCFTPSRRLRETFEMLGLRLEIDHLKASRQIHQFISDHIGEERATFQLGYDLPFWYRLHEEIDS